MDKIIKVLKKNKLNESMLPTSIQQKIDELEKLILKHNAEVDELDSLESVTEEQEQHIEQQSSLIDTQEEGIYNEILEFLEEKAKKEEEEKEKKDSEEKAKLEAQKLAQEEADKKAKEEAEKNKPEPKKKSGLGMFILGAVVLVATAGVVNVMSKK